MHRLATSIRSASGAGDRRTTYGGVHPPAIGGVYDELWRIGEEMIGCPFIVELLYDKV